MKEDAVDGEGNNSDVENELCPLQVLSNEPNHDSQSHRNQGRSCNRYTILVATGFVLIVSLIVVVSLSSLLVKADPTDAATSASTSDFTSTGVLMGTSSELSSSTSLPSTVTSTPSSLPPTRPPRVPYDMTRQGCLPDRFDNEAMTVVNPNVNFNRLYPGQFLCSKAGTQNYPEQTETRYQFGLDTSGNILWKDTTTHENILIYHYPQEKSSATTDKDDNDNQHELNIYLALSTNGTMILYQYHDDDDNNNNNNIETSTPVWTALPVKAQYPIAEHKLCLPDHNCPYFHLHSDGVMILNWIPPYPDNDAGWQVRNFLRLYDFLH